MFGCLLGRFLGWTSVVYGDAEDDADDDDDNLAEQVNEDVGARLRRVKDYKTKVGRFGVAGENEDDVLRLLWHKKATISDWIHYAKIMVRKVMPTCIHGREDDTQGGM